MNIIKVHELLSHSNEDSMRQTARHLGWIITHSNLKPCVHCTKSKAKQKNVCRASHPPKAAEHGGMVHLDLSKVTVSRSDGSDFELMQKNWRSIVDEATGKKW